jgi:hypothetical protein
MQDLPPGLARTVSTSPTHCNPAMILQSLLYLLPSYTVSSLYNILCVTVSYYKRTVLYVNTYYSTTAYIVTRPTHTVNLTYTLTAPMVTLHCMPQHSSHYSSLLKRNF